MSCYVQKVTPKYKKCIYELRSLICSGFYKSPIFVKIVYHGTIVNWLKNVKDNRELGTFAEWAFLTC